MGLVFPGEWVCAAVRMFFHDLILNTLFTALQYTNIHVEQLMPKKYSFPFNLVFEC